MCKANLSNLHSTSCFLLLQVWIWLTLQRCEAFHPVFLLGKKKKSRESKTQASLNMSSTCFFHHYTTKKLKTTTDTGNQIKLTGLQNIRWWCEKVLSLKLILGTGLSNVKQRRPAVWAVKQSWRGAVQHIWLLRSQSCLLLLCSKHFPLRTHWRLYGK